VNLGIGHPFSQRPQRIGRVVFFKFPGHPG
jgi:hypothetical protein